MAVERGRRSRPNLKVGICGEHGGDPKSIDFCHRAGLDYVSCSPYRVPVARLAAAHAAMAARGGPVGPGRTKAGPKASAGKGGKPKATKPAARRGARGKATPKRRAPTAAARR